MAAGEREMKITTLSEGGREGAGLNLKPEKISIMALLPMVSLVAPIKWGVWSESGGKEK